MVLDTREQLRAKIRIKKRQIRSKGRQISNTRKMTKPRRITIADQFSVGSIGIKPLRARRRADRIQALDDLPVLNTQLSTLRSGLVIEEQRLIDFVDPRL